MATRGRPRKARDEEDSWVPITNAHKYKESFADSTMTRIKKERVIEGFKALHKVAFGVAIKDNDMKKIHKIANELGF